MHTLLHIGAGMAAELDQWLTSGAQHIVLVEPHPELAERLRRLAQPHTQVRVVEAAVSVDPARQQLQEYNLPEVSSLRPATGLKALFPGLKATAQHVVPILTPTELVETYGPPGETEGAEGEKRKSATLVLQAPGEEQAIIQALIDADQLQRFNRLDVTVSPEPLYEGSVGASQLLDTLADYGYEIAETNTDDPDWPSWLLTLSPLKPRLQKVEAEQATLKQQLAAKNETLAEQKTQQQRLDKQLKAAQDELAATQQARAEAEKAHAASQQAAERAQQEIQALNAGQAKLQKQLAESEQAHADSQKAAQQLKANLAESQEKLEQQDKALAEQKTQRQRLDKQLKAAQDELAATQQARAEAEKAHAASQQAAERAQQEAQEFNAGQAKLQKQLTEHQEKLEQQDKALAEQQDQLAQKDKSLTEQKTQQQRLDKQLKAAQDELATAQQARAEAEKAHAESQQAAEQDVQQLKAKLAEQQEKLEQTHTWFMNRKQQAEEGAEQIKALQGEHQASQARLTQAEAALREKDATIARLDEQLAAQRQGNDETQSRFAALESKLEGLFGEQRSYIQQTTSALGQHVTRTSRQQRDEQALTHYLQHGQRPVSTELSPGFAMALLEHRETQRYAVMVVLGSTPVTELLAQAVNNESLQQPQLTATHPTEQGKELQHYITPSQDDLPQAVISMAHKKSIGKALKQRLAASHNQAAVNVVHAPWVEANAQGELFYAWEATLKRLNQWLEEDAKVLVVIGNALAEANHSRISALPPLLQHLPTQTLDVVVEGNHYPHESGLKAEWEAVLGKRERDVEELHLPTALGLRITG